MTPTKILEIYRRRQTIKATAREAGCSEGVVRKVLVGAGIIKTPLTERIAELRNAGMTQSDIAKLLGLSDTYINVNTPYIGKSYQERRKTPCFSYGDIRRISFPNGNLSDCANSDQMV